MAPLSSSEFPAILLFSVDFLCDGRAAAWGCVRQVSRIFHEARCEEVAGGLPSALRSFIRPLSKRSLMDNK